jgi:hypothetical protein
MVVQLVKTFSIFVEPEDSLSHIWQPTAFPSPQPDGSQARPSHHVSVTPVFRHINKLWETTVSFITSVCPTVHVEQLSSNGWIFMKLDVWGFLKNLLRNLKFHYNFIWITGTLRNDQYIFMIISCSIPLRLRNVSINFFPKIMQ